MSAQPLDLERLAVLDSLSKHIALLDAQGTIVLTNRAWQEFGLANGGTCEQACSVGINYLDMCERCDLQCPGTRSLQIKEGIESVLSGAEPHFELEYACHAPGEQRWFLMRVSPLVGGREGVVVSHENITQRWQLEQQQKALVAELLTANRELSDFAHVVSHDLKAPLRGISSLASWLVTDFADKLGAVGREHLNLISSRVKRDRKSTRLNSSH